MPDQIRTPDQRLRVFVSSTLAELADERAAVARAITAVRLTPVMFELGARPHPPRDLYRAYLDQSDIFVGIYWQRYGWVAPDMDISGLEDELVLSRGMPRLLYVKKPAPEREPRLTEMIEQLESDATESFRPFRTARELGTLVRDDLAVLLSERFVAADHRAGHSTPPAASADARDGSDPEREQVRVRAPSLPATATTLVGRDREIEEVTKLLEAPDVRLVTLTGPGGIGKTRLATAVAERLSATRPAPSTTDTPSPPTTPITSPALPPAVVFVPLESVARPEVVLSHVVTAVGASAEGARPALDVLAEHLAATPTLLVLDNLEQVADVAPELDELVARCPGLKILATSRVVLRLRREHEYPVPPLTTPSASGLSERSPVEAVASLSAVQLFVDRARSVRPDFALTAENAPFVAEICRRLDGLPLAIELAAARSRLLDPAALLARLEHGLDALGTGPVDLPERQRTLRATVEWSVGLLDDAERELLAALSVFVGGWTIEAASDVAGLDEGRTLDLLDTLVGHSLVQAASSSTGLGGGPSGPSGPRFRMLETIRDHAAGLLAGSPARDDVRRRHAEHVERLVVASDWTGRGLVQPGWDQRLHADEGNIRVAIRWFFDNDITPLPHLFRILWVYWQMRDLVAEGRALVGELLPRAGELDDHAHMELAITAGVVAIEIGDDDEAVDAADRIERLIERVDDPFLHGVAHLIRSWVLPIRDDLPGALQAARASVDTLRGGDEPFMLGSALMTVGMLEIVMGDPEAARRHLAELDSSPGPGGHGGPGGPGGPRGSGDFEWFRSAQQVQLAALAIEDGQLAEARERLVTAVADDPAGLTTQVLSFGLVAGARLALLDGDASRAARALGACEGLRQRARLRVWPLQRRSEDDLLDEVRRSLDPDTFHQAFTQGAHLPRLAAIDLLHALAAG